MQTFIGAATVATSTNFLAIGLTVFGIVKAIGAFNLTLNPEIVKWAERIAYVAIAIGGIRAGGWL